MIFGDTVLCCCFFFSCSAPTTVSVVLFLLLFSCCWSSWSVRCHPEGDDIFRFAPCTCGSRVSLGQLSSLSRVLPTTRARFPREFSPLFHAIRAGAFAFIFSLLPRLSRQNRKTNEPSEKKNHGTAALSRTHTQHAGRRWQSHNRVCKIFLPFCHTQNDCFRNSDQKRPQNLREFDRLMSTLLFPRPEYDLAAK